MPVYIREFDTKIFAAWFAGRTLGNTIDGEYFVAIGSWILFLWYLKLYINKIKTKKIWNQ